MDLESDVLHGVFAPPAPKPDRCDYKYDLNRGCLQFVFYRKLF